MGKWALHRDLSEILGALSEKADRIILFTA